MAPIARLSLNAKIAVGRSAASSRRLVRRDAALDLEVRSDLERGVGHDPGRGERGVVAAPALLGGEPADRAGDGADAPVPEAQQVLDRLVRA